MLCSRSVNNLSHCTNRDDRVTTCTSDQGSEKTRPKKETGNDYALVVLRKDGLATRQELRHMLLLVQIDNLCRVDVTLMHRDGCGIQAVQHWL